MATIVLGAVGGIVGSAFGQPYLGFSIGSTIGSLIDASNRPGGHVDQGRLSDLRISDSSYGNTLPMLWGNVRIATNLIWSLDLEEHSKTTNVGGGKGGGGSTTTNYWYTCSFAYGVGCGTLMYPDGTLVTNFPTSPAFKLWADDTLIHDSSLSTNILTVRMYTGTEVQAVDTLIQTACNANPTKYSGGVAPAYRGTIYFVIEEMQLYNYNNRNPNFSIEISGNPVTVGSILTDLLRLAGLGATDIDMSAATDVVQGYSIPQMATVQDAINPLLQAYLYDLPEIDGKLVAVKRGSPIVVNIPYSDLGAALSVAGSANTNSVANGANESQIPVHITEVYGMVTDLPSRVSITYYSHNTDPTIDRHYEQSTQSDVRETVAVYNDVSIQLPLTLDDTTARQIAAQQLDIAWRERSTFKIVVSIKYLWLTCADVITMTVGSRVLRLRIVNFDIGNPGEIHISLVLDDDTAVAQSIGGASGSGNTPVSAGIVATSFIVWSGTELRDQDQLNAGFYVAGTAPNGWTGAEVWYSVDAGTTWIDTGALPALTAVGSMTSALANGVTANAFDNTDTVTVSIGANNNATLSSTSDGAITQGQNVALIGNEIIGVGTATISTTGNYTLSHLYRGMRASSMSNHVSSEHFALLNPSAIIRVNVSSAEVGQTVQVKVVSSGQTLAMVTAQSVVIATPTPTSTSVALSNVKTIPFWRMKGYENDQLTSTSSIDSTYFDSGVNKPSVVVQMAWTQFCSGPGGSIIQQGNLDWALWCRMGLKNTNASNVTVTCSIPFIDDGLKIIWAGAVILNKNSSTGALDNNIVTFTIGAGITGTLEIFYFNKEGGTRDDSTNPGVLAVMINALDQSGVTFVDVGP